MIGCGDYDQREDYFRASNRDASSKSLFCASELIRRRAELSPEERTERAQTLESHGETNLGDREIGMKQQIPRALQSLRGQELMRRLPERLPKSPQKMIGRETGDPGHLVNRDRLLERGGDEFFRAMKPPVKLFAGRGAQRGKRFDLSIDSAMNLQQPPAQFVKPLIDPDLVFFSVLQRGFEPEQRRRKDVVMGIGLLEEADRLDSRRARIIQQFRRRSDQAVINLFGKPVFEKNAERFDGLFRIDNDLVRLALIEYQIGVRAYSVTPSPDIIKRLAAVKRFDGQTTGARPMMPPRRLADNEAESAERLGLLSGVPARQSVF